MARVFFFSQSHSIVKRNKSSSRFLLTLNFKLLFLTFTNNNFQLLKTLGVDPEYDKALADIQATRTWFDQYLKKQCAALGCKVKYLNPPKVRVLDCLPSVFLSIRDKGLDAQRKEIVMRRDWDEKRFSPQPLLVRTTLLRSQGWDKRYSNRKRKDWLKVLYQRT